MSVATLMKRADERYDVALKVSDIIAFRNSINEGDVLHSGKKHLTIVKKHPFWALTNQGCMAWIDIYEFVQGWFNAPIDYVYVDKNCNRKSNIGGMHG